MQYIGIDIGTSSVKLLLMDEKGNILSSATRDYPVAYPRIGWSEQAPEDWFQGTMAGLKELLCAADKKSVRGIGVGGQMHGLVMLDSADRVIRPAILWNDGRAREETRFLNETIGRETLAAYTGNIAFAGFTAPKLLWVREREPENYGRIAKLMLPKDYLAYRLTGEHSTDPTDASGMLLFDVKNRRWSEEMLKICGVEAGWLPRVYESCEQTGILKRSIAEELRLGSVKVCAGAGDNAAAAVGTGTVHNGMCNISLGTSGTVLIAGDRFFEAPNNALHSFAHATAKYLLLGCILSAASCGTWWLEKILRTSDYTAEQEAVSALGENGVYFLPYLMGERSPHNDPFARGAFIGMDASATRAQMTQAVYEGVTFALRDSFEVARSLGLSIPSAKLCGGGARSPLWRRLAANILNVPVEIPAVEEGPSLGAAMLAAVCCGEYESIEVAADAIVRVAHTIEPEPALAEKYEDRYRMFRSFYPALKSAFAGMARL